jgi:hypothetical protein
VYAGHELVVDERPYDEVVAAPRERPDPVDGVGFLCADHDHWEVAKRVECRRVAEQDEIGMSPRGQLERRVTIIRAQDVKSVLCEMTLEEAANAGLGLCNQDSRHPRKVTSARRVGQMSFAP